MSLLEKLSHGRLYFDGAMGSQLIAAGMSAGDIPDLYSLSHPELVRGIHEKYLEAGCDIVVTNTFGANPVKLPQENIELVIGSALQVARDAISRVGGQERYVALDIGPTGHLLKPLGDLSFEDAYQSFASVVRAGKDADLILIETISDLYELKAAVLAAKENSTLPVFATVTLDEKGQLLTGADVAGVVALLEGLRVDALGLNCSHAPHDIYPFAKALMEYASIPVIVCPNAGLPGFDDSHGHQTAASFAADMAKIAALGVSVLGGCCGTTPAHIAAMISAAKDIPCPPITRKSHTIVTSGCQSLMWGEAPLLVGERLNPTGKKALKQALTEGRMDYLLREAVAQQTAGAHVLDVNVGLPGLDEAALMVHVVTELQGVIALPLQLDSADPHTLEAALRIYNGKAMINSVNGKVSSMETVFPLVAKYGGVVVGLTLDESGIPETPEGRLSIAKNIISNAESYGISKKDIVIDGLTLAASSNVKEAQTTLDTIRLLHDKLGVHTILGVSNISFGLPQREQLNAAFFTMAMNQGLSSAIINPCSAAMLASYHAYCALKGYDDGFETYVAHYSDHQEGFTPPTALPSLGRLIQDGLSGEAAIVTKELLTTQAPLDIINTQIIPALDAVGADFEICKKFLPQLLRSAETAQSAFSVLRQHMEQNNMETIYKGRVVIATVKGDIHDIGKNIAKVLLSNYGYEVIDLGKDVPPEIVVEAALSSHAPFVGLSALMTTTVKSMEETITALHEGGFTGKIFVSGAIMTAEYADMIGADIYIKDAMAAIEYMSEQSPIN